MSRIGFGDFTLDSLRRLLTREGAPVHLAPTAFRLLELLIENRPAVLSKRQIMDALWPDRAVCEGGVGTLISQVRSALGARAGAYIRTVHGVGYGFCAEATELAPGPAAAAAPRFVLVQAAPRRRIGLPDGAVVIGRHVECDVQIPSRTVSRRHARIRVAEGVATVEDLDSYNGTYVCGEKVTRPVRLQDGDTLRVGSIELVFRSTSASESETESAG